MVLWSLVLYDIFRYRMSQKYKLKLERFKHNPILIPRENVEWEARAVFNPSVICDNGIFKMLYRTYPKKTEQTTPRNKRPGFNLKNQISYIGYAESLDGINWTRRDTPFIAPSEEYDMFGCEYPRITKIDDVFYITYTAIDRPLDTKDTETKVRIALATTKDFVTVEKHGIIGPPKTSKASAFFPEKVNGGKIALAMTISSDSANSHVAIRYFDSMNEVMNQTDESWAEFLKKSQETAVLRTEWFFHRGPELGAPPIKTDRGWLFVFSNESMSDSWTIGVALTDLEEPHKLIARTPGYLLQGARDYEMQGFVTRHL